MKIIINAIKIIADIVGFILAFIIPIRLYNGVRYFHSAIYSSYFKRSFNKCGANFFVRSPLYVIGPKYISIGKNFYAGYRLRMEAISQSKGIESTPKISIGDNVGFNFDCHIGCANSVTIGNNVLFSSRVFITDHFHGKIDSNSLLISPRNRPIYSKGPVIIENNVWIGEGVVIMPNITIGKNSIIGANSVVTKSIPENSVAAGAPAIVIKKLDLFEDKKTN